MTKPNFETIPLKEFLAYLRKNRQDNEAWSIYLARLDKEASHISFPAPKGVEDIRNAINSNPELKAKFGS